MQNKQTCSALPFFVIESSDAKVLFLLYNMPHTGNDVFGKEPAVSYRVRSLFAKQSEESHHRKIIAASIIKRAFVFSGEERKGLLMLLLQLQFSPIGVARRPESGMMMRKCVPKFFLFLFV